MIAAGLLLSNCGASDKFASNVDPRYGVSPSPRVVEFGQDVPKGGGTYRLGRPYLVAGRLYTPTDNRRYRAEGLASWYGRDFHGRLTANGEVFDMEGISAAHPTLPMPSYVRVTNLHNRKSMIVRVNDRGPYHSNRVIDLSSKAAEALDFQGRGVARVRVEYVGPAPLEGSDDRMLIATLREGAPAPAPSRVMLASAKPFVPSEPEVRRVGEGGRLPQLASADPDDASGALPPLLRGSAPPPADYPATAYAPPSDAGYGFVASGRGLY